MASKRSPILGYNHNVRFRGIVFHIQTEDSGVINPHVFTHLFHGGVIISTRKLVYDPGSNDDAVKSLMQAQHKAVMKDLRRGTFDDKIDSYLVGTEGLLPRHVDPVEAAALDDPPLEAAPAALADAALADAALADAALADAALADAALADAALADAALADAALADALAGAAEDASPDPTDRIDLVSMTVDTDDTVASSSAALDGMAALDAALDSARLTPEPLLARAPTPLPLTPPAPDEPAAIGRAPTARVDARVDARTRTIDPSLAGLSSDRNDVSAAMQAIQVADAELSAAGLDDVAEIHSPAPPSAPTPPGAQPERVGEYQVSRPEATATPPRPVNPRQGAARSLPPPIPRSSLPPRAPTPLGNKVPLPVAATTRVPVIPPSSSRSVPPRSPPRTVTPPSPPVAARTSTPPSRGRPQSGGVVVSRPAVIVGNRPATQPPPTKVRRARESFGGDLISERSLDEVILAYLSEDASED